MPQLSIHRFKTEMASLTRKRKTLNDDDNDDDRSIGTEEERKREQRRLDAEDEVEREIEKIADCMKGSAQALIEELHDYNIYADYINEDDEKGLLFAFNYELEFGETMSDWAFAGSPIYVYIAVNGAYEIEYEGEVETSHTYAWNVAERVKQLLKKEDRKRKKAEATKQ